MERSKVLFLRPQNAARANLPTAIADDWWVIAGDTDTPPPADCVAGLLLLTHPLPDRAVIEPYLARAEQLPWVALIDPAQARAPLVRRLAQRYCCDALPWPAAADRLRAALERARSEAVAAAEFASAPDRRMIGASAVTRVLLQDVRKLAAVDAPVLIQGESGTGKELAAHSLHECSRRAQGPFIAVNCGALPANLIQSELFGHERGSFTGAQARKIGRLQAADGGTIFLDEIGDLHLDLQANLLRFLQEGTIERVGGSGPIAVNTRVIAATHVDLEQAVAEHRFRADLYYRLNVLRLDMPPLRDRPSDVPLLARHFFHRFAAEKAPQVKGFAADALEAMARHEWPGNVRELLNRVRRAMVMCEGRWITAADLGLEGGSGGGVPTLAQARARAERAVIEQALAATGHNISQAAGLLRVSRVTLYRLLDKHGLPTAAESAAASRGWSAADEPELASA